MHGTPARARTRRQVPHENPRTQGSSAHFGADSSQNFFSCARTKASSAHRTPKPPTWSTTSGVWMQKPRRAPPRGRAVSQNSHRTQGCGRPPGTSRCSPRRTQPRGRPPRPLRCRFRTEPMDVGEQPARTHIEPRDVVDHLPPLDATYAEPREKIVAATKNKGPRRKGIVGAQMGRLATALHREGRSVFWGRYWGDSFAAVAL
jgi:hypothetical protein